MVIRANFSGNITETEDLKGSTTENIALPVKSETETYNFTHLPLWSKVFLQAIYQILLDGGYKPILNEADYSITVLDGFKFYVLGTPGSGYMSNYVQPGIVIHGTTQMIQYYNPCWYPITNKTQTGYNFTLTLRGSENVVCIDGFSENNSQSTYGVIFLAKAIHIATKREYFMVNLYAAYINYFIEKNNLYNIIYSSNCLLPTLSSYDSDSLKYDSYDQFYGIGKGYNKIPLLTTHYDFMIKDMIYTDQMIKQDEYYKIGNEIYYANYIYNNDYKISTDRFLYKVDTVVAS